MEPLLLGWVQYKIFYYLKSLFSTVIENACSEGILCGVTICFVWASKTVQLCVSESSFTAI